MAKLLVYEEEARQKLANGVGKLRGACAARWGLEAATPSSIKVGAARP